MPKDDLPELRAEARDGWWCLFLGGEKIATYVPTPAGRAAVEQVIENWRARRANGETDSQIIAAQGHRPTKPIPGTPKWLEAKVAEHTAEIERLKEKAMDFKNAAERAQDAADESVKARQDRAAHRIARAQDLIIEAAADLTLTRPEIVSYVQANWASPDWTPEERELCGDPYREKSIYSMIRDLVERDMISSPRDPRK
jgi:hypothetical protein